jgi:hypothetical protein
MIKIWMLFISLGVPGLALGVFFMLFRKIKPEIPPVPPIWAGPIVVIYMLLASGLIFSALTLWSPPKNQKSSDIPAKPYEQVLSGSVHTESNRPLSGVSISLPQFGKTFYTNNLGRFEIKVKAKHQAGVELIAQKDGYEPHECFTMLGEASTAIIMKEKR